MVQIFVRIARIPAAATEPSSYWGWVSGTSVSYNRTIHTGLKVPAVVRGGMLLVYVLETQLRVDVWSGRTMRQ